MKKPLFRPTRTLRFRRWSRKRYAAFCSVGRVVSIGQVKKSITDASLGKQGLAAVLAATDEGGRPDDTALDDGSGGPTASPTLLLEEEAVQACQAVAANPVPSRHIRSVRFRTRRAARPGGAAGSCPFRPYPDESLNRKALCWRN